MVPSIFFKSPSCAKSLAWVGDGFGIWYKRLLRGSFGTPVYNSDTKMMVLEKKDLLLILEGVEGRFRRRYERSGWFLEVALDKEW